MPEIATERISCRTCDTSVGLSRCAGCHAISYCSAQCQRKDWPRHKHNCLPVLLTEVQGKGRGLVASKDFKKGDLIFTETAAISVDGFGEGIQVWGADPKNLPMSNDPMIMKSFMNQVMGLSDRERAKLFEGDLSLARREKIICLDMFLINHSCAPNSAKGVLETKETGGKNKKKMELRAIKSIVKGEEITICYLDKTESALTPAEMKTVLQDIFEFDCQCDVCTGKICDQDDLRLLLDAGLRTVHDMRDQSSVYDFKLNDWKKETLMLENLVNILAMQYYIGRVENIPSMCVAFAFAAQMARDPVRLQKAMDVFKKIAEDTRLEFLKLKYDFYEKFIGQWAAELKSMKPPAVEEIEYFYRSNPHAMNGL